MSILNSKKFQRARIRESNGSNSTSTYLMNCTKRKMQGDKVEVKSKS